MTAQLVTLYGITDLLSNRLREDGGFYTDLDEAKTVASSMATDAYPCRATVFDAFLIDGSYYLLHSRAPLCVDKQAHEKRNEIIRERALAKLSDQELRVLGLA